MPIVNIWMREGTEAHHRKAVADGVHRAMNDTLGTPADDFFAVVHELDDEHLLFDPNYFGIPRSERFVMVQMFFNARPAVVKERLYDAIADNLEHAAGLARTDLMINIAEVAPENWWLEGRQIDPATGTDARMSGA